MKTGCFTKNRILLGTAMFLASFCLVSCGQKEDVADNKINVFYVTTDETSIVSKEYELKTNPNEDIDGAVNELQEMLENSPGKSLYEAPLSGDASPLSFRVVGNVLSFEFGAQYNKIGTTREVLGRAAIVRTFTQLEPIKYVYFFVGKKEPGKKDMEPLRDHSGSPIGPMKADTFIYNVGNEINTYEKKELKLYFANEAGDKLIPVYRSIVYNSNISMEKIAIEQVINGPNTDVAFPTINKDTKINSVNIKDKVCFIDFDSSFLTQPNNVTVQTALYSIVNTATEFPNVDRVVISVDGNSSFTYMDFNISGAYKQNSDIISR
jgi:germination protein M